MAHPSLSDNTATYNKQHTTNIGQEERAGNRVLFMTFSFVAQSWPERQHHLQPTPKRSPPCRTQPWEPEEGVSAFHLQAYNESKGFWFGRLAMTVRGIVKDGVVVPVEPVQLPEGADVLMELQGPESPGAWAERFFGKADDLPGDSARNLDHYLYGHPKR